MSGNITSNCSNPAMSQEFGIETTAVLRHLQVFGEWYTSIHAYVNLVIFVFGFILNSMNVVVLTRKTMGTPVNTVLTVLASNDLLLLVHYGIISCLVLGYGYKEVWRASLYPEHFDSSGNVRLVMWCGRQYLHSMSLWLTVVLCMIRFIIIRFPICGKIFITIFKTRVIIVSTYIAIAMTTFPVCCYKNKNYSVVSVNNCSDMDTNGSSSNSSHAGNTVTRNITKYHMSYMWTDVGVTMENIALKVLPCILLTIFTLLLVAVLVQVGLKNKRLHANEHRTNKGSRVTKMLILVVVITLISAVPHAVLRLVANVYQDEYYIENVTFYLQDLFHSLMLINSSINFFIFYFMSRDFRAMFLRIFIQRFKQQHPSGRTRLYSHSATIPLTAITKDNGHA